MLTARSFTMKPADLGNVVEITDDSGAALATMRAGQLTAASGETLLRLAVSKPGAMSGARRDNPAEVSLQIGDAQGAPAGGAKIVKYGFGPRAKKLTLVLMRPDGAEEGRLEPADDKGEQLVATVGGAAAATVAVEQVKAGFLRKARVYTVHLTLDPSPLLLGALVGYEALLQAAMAVSMRD
jgi:hypothetical protein